MFTKQTVKDIDVANKTVLVRADYNVPLKQGQITDDFRIKQSLPTIKYLIDKNAKIIICSHLGRPAGKPTKDLSLKPIAQHLSKLVGQSVNFSPEAIGPEALNQAKQLKPGQLLLLENLRFYPGEEADDDDFAKQLASLAEVFVQDGFGVVHRKHASTWAITKHLPSVAGLLLAKEVDVLTKVMKSPERPLMAIIGGAKVDDKLEILKHFIELADVVAVGGALANPFLAAQGIDVENSLSDKASIKIAKQVMALAEAEATKRPFTLILPHDSVVAERIDKTAQTRIVDFSSNSYADIVNYPRPVSKKAVRLLKSEKILDIGPFSAAFIAGTTQLAKTVVWNGTLGVTEVKGLQGPIGPFAHGTETVIEALVGDLGSKPFTVVGGGDTVGYIEERHLTDCFNHVSTGGGASLELMSGHKLPGVEALRDK